MAESSTTPRASQQPKGKEAASRDNEHATATALQNLKQHSLEEAQNKRNYTKKEGESIADYGTRIAAREGVRGAALYSGIPPQAANQLAAVAETVAENKQIKLAIILYTIAPIVIVIFSILMLAVLGMAVFLSLWCTAKEAAGPFKFIIDLFDGITNGAC